MKSKTKHFTYETKKEYIIRLAKKDPFLKIEEIAEIAQTTQRYVRTILSEASLSLMNLREEYARKMEKYSELKILFSIKDSINGFCMEENSPTFTYGTVQSQQIESPEDYKWNTDKLPLYQYLQQVYYYQIPVSIVSFVTAVQLTEEKSVADISLFKLLGLKQEETRITNPEIEIGSLANFLGDNYVSDFAPEDFMIKISTLVSVKNNLFGEERFYFPSDSIKLTIPGIFNSTLQLVKGS